MFIHSHRKMYHHITLNELCELVALAPRGPLLNSPFHRSNNEDDAAYNNIDSSTYNSHRTRPIPILHDTEITIHPLGEPGTLNDTLLRNHRDCNETRV